MDKSQTTDFSDVADDVRPGMSGGPAPIRVTEREHVLAALLNATSALYRFDDPQLVIQCVCDSIVGASAHIKLVWAWFGDPDTSVIVPQIFAGPASSYAQSLRIERNDMTLRGPAYRALHTESFDYLAVSANSEFAPWRMASKELGFQVAAAFPLRVSDSRQRGLLIFYSGNIDYFHMVGAEPFRALARVAETALTQAKLNRDLKELAETDPLTGLHNRRYMDHALPRSRALAGAHSASCVLMLIDVDYFKSVNDDFGHEAGDQVLIRLAEILRGALRREDLAARWGGDEFLCALPQSDMADGAALAQRIHACIAADRLTVMGKPVRWRVSIGLACFRNGAEPIEAALRRADAALYAAKTKRRDRVYQPT